MHLDKKLTKQARIIAGPHSPKISVYRGKINFFGAVTDLEKKTIVLNKELNFAHERAVLWHEVAHLLIRNPYLRGAVFCSKVSGEEYEICPANEADVQMYALRKAKKLGLHKIYDELLTDLYYWLTFKKSNILYAYRVAGLKVLRRLKKEHMRTKIRRRSNAKN